MSDAAARSGQWRRRRWSGTFWIVELTAIAAILIIVLALQYSEEGYMRRHGIRVTAAVDELRPGQKSCIECPLVFTLDGELYHVHESLVAGGDGEGGQRRYVAGEAVALYVDPHDMTHVIEVDAVGENVGLGKTGIAIVAFFVLAWPIYEFKRWIPPSVVPAH